MGRSVSLCWPRLGPAALLFSMTTLTVWATPARGQQSSEELDRLLYEECRAPEEEEESHGHESRLSDHCIPLADLTERPKPIIELGAPFLGTGTLHRGIQMPGGAVWQPAFLAFGTVRTAAQGGSFGGPDGTNRQLAEVPVRLDLFGNLYLTRTERILVGIRPLDRDGQFTGLTLTDGLSPPVDEDEDGEVDETTGFSSELNAAITTLFFEGDFAELFPNLDRNDSRGLDFYFSVGRQPLDFQDGLLVNEDILDMVGLTRANMKIGGAVNTRLTGVYAWGELNRQGPLGNAPAEGDQMFGLFSEMDFRSTTVQVDAAYVIGTEETGDGVHAAIGDTRRIGRFNSTFRALFSMPIGTETPFNAQGVLLHEQFSWTPHGNHNLWYISGFAGIGEFRSAARGPSAGGPVGVTGVLFAAPGIGRLGALLGSNADNAVGGSIGHQMFFDHTRQQLVIEAGTRVPTMTDEDLDIGIGTRAALAARYQMAMGQRFVLVADVGGSYDFEAALSNAVARLELVLKL